MAPTDSPRTDRATPLGALPSGVDAESHYLKIPAGILDGDVAMPLNLFTRIGGEFIVVCRVGECLRRPSVAFTQDEIFVRHADHGLYRDYLMGRVKRLLERATRESASAAFDRFYGTALAVTRDVLDDPQSEMSEELAGGVVEASVARLAEEPDVFSYFDEAMKGSPDLYRHSLHVCLYGLALGGAVGLRAELRDLGIGLLLHDVGKLDWPPGLLERRGELDLGEWELVRDHPSMGLARVETVSWVEPPARDVILSHHERLDGSGYPRGIGPADFSAAARVAAIANHFESHTTNRPFRVGRPTFKVLKEMISKDKGLFDPDLLVTFVRMLSMKP